MLFVYEIIRQTKYALVVKILLILLHFLLELLWWLENALLRNGVQIWVQISFFYNYSHYIHFLKLAVLTETLINYYSDSFSILLSVCLYLSLSYSFFLYLSLFFPSLSSLSVISQWLGADNLSDSRGLFFFSPCIYNHLSHPSFQNELMDLWCDKPNWPVFDPRWQGLHW